ncbi:MAG: molecular chaperone HtpG [Chlorobium sp.]|jgi:molecular chaperone HtpG|uniref:molecular chaperone HtpG n=1 Tax=Chlorobium sp. TaxID=1095 RepID=UPI0025BF5FA0|nr:molecular chaperone HtpG [Chlorobium sp.]MCF8216530.1 molecular chaperone HtpG [Chlorobium sp.]MCF8271435.1 molecular chaperone HtpG [Chlorobium sp.]MCF8287807.1 molecular chaperone HtpG [Chlorobium sp.]MCF8291346.1 molecular chaperone HtpG [Chlorobium sp.]MCF8385441.1 molecular chaperone HtpG [Chlorobium sp.]
MNNSNPVSPVQEFEYKAEMKQLLDLIVHSLYTHPEIFLRELISNASDALAKVRFGALTDQTLTEGDSDLGIRITIDPEELTFVIEDNGIGMTEEELITNLGTVAKSGTLGFMQALKEQQKELDGNLIGQFGVGFYSVFMVTDEVTVETRSAKTDSEGYRWKSAGQGTYTIEKIDKPGRGTKIFFKLKEESKEFAEEYRVEHIIKKYSNFVDFPIRLGDKQVNSMTALWQRSKSELKDEEVNEFYKFIANDFQDPLDYLHVSVEGMVSFKALLFLPKEAPMDLLYRQSELENRGPQLYVKKVMIQHECRDLLPEYLRFIGGVVDTEDLSLNVSREIVQSSPVMSKIRQILTGKILGWFETLAKEQPEKFRTFYKAFGPIVKIGLNTDFTNRDKLIELLRFESTKTAEEEYVTLKEYIGRMQEDQKEIYYHSGSNRSQLLAHPNLEYFQDKGIEVLLLSDPVDVFVIPSISEYEKKPLKSIEKADIDFSAEKKAGSESLPENLLQPVLGLFREKLGDRIEDVVESHRLVTSPVTLVSGKDALDSQMERMMKMMQTEMPAGKKILEVNTAHPIIRNLSGMYMANAANPLISIVIEQLYDGALLHEGGLDSTTAFLSRMNDLIEAATLQR